MKLYIGYMGDIVFVSRPAWGAWIETVPGEEIISLVRSRPAWGAWIETHVYGTFHNGGVAPRMGRVD